MLSVKVFRNCLINFILIFAIFVINIFTLSEISCDGCNNIIAPEYILNKRTKITPKMEDKTARPLNFSKSNNLRRRAGSFTLAKGEYLILKGRVEDLLGRPIQNAVVKIWQANNFGYYNFLVKDKQDYSQYDIDFESTGTAITNNLGYYQFFTIFPGFYWKRTPHIHILVSHRLFPEVETEIFFPHYPRNKIDKKYNLLSLEQQKLLTCEIIEEKDKALKTCIFNIKIDFIYNH